MRDRAQITLVVRLKDQFVAFTGVAAKDLSSGRQKNAFRKGDDALDRDSGVVNAVLAANQVLRDQRTVYPWQDMVVHRVHFAERRSHLAHLGDEALRERREGDIAFLE